MGSPAISLDQGPPLPPGLAPAPQASAQGLAGPGPAQAAQSGSASLQSLVIQKLMMAEQIFDDIGKIMPAAAPVLSGLVDQIRKGMGAVLAQGATPPPAQGAPGGGMMMSPTGAAGAAPTS